jgi:hypothetical protein
MLRHQLKVHRFQDGSSQYGKFQGDQFMEGVRVDELKQGAKVEARFGGGEDYFPARVVAVNADGTFHIKFDQGLDETAAPFDDLRRADFDAGSPVQFHKGRGCFLELYKDSDVARAQDHARKAQDASHVVNVASSDSDSDKQGFVCRVGTQETGDRPLTVTLLTGRTLELVADLTQWHWPAFLTQVVMPKIASAAGIPPRLQRLEFGDRRLDKQGSLAHNKIKPGATLTLALARPAAHVIAGRRRGARKQWCGDGQRYTPMLDGEGQQHGRRALVELRADLRHMVGGGSSVWDSDSDEGSDSDEDSDSDEGDESEEETEGGWRATGAEGGGDGEWEDDWESASDDGPGVFDSDAVLVERVRRVLSSEKWTQCKFAEQASVSHPQLSHLLNGKTYLPSSRTTTMVRNYLDRRAVLLQGLDEGAALGEGGEGGGGGGGGGGSGGERAQAWLSLGKTAAGAAEPWQCLICCNEDHPEGASCFAMPCACNITICRGCVRRDAASEGTDGSRCPQCHGPTGFCGGPVSEFVPLYHRNDPASQREYEAEVRGGMDPSVHYGVDGEAMDDDDDDGEFNDNDGYWEWVVSCSFFVDRLGRYWSLRPALDDRCRRVVRRRSHAVTSSAQGRTLRW